MHVVLSATGSFRVEIVAQLLFIITHVKDGKESMKKK